MTQGARLFILLACIHTEQRRPVGKFFIPSMIAGTLAVIGCDSLLFYARISLDKGPELLTTPAARTNCGDC